MRASAALAYSPARYVSRARPRDATKSRCEVSPRKVRLSSAGMRTSRATTPPAHAATAGSGSRRWRLIRGRWGRCQQAGDWRRAGVARRPEDERRAADDRDRERRGGEQRGSMPPTGGCRERERGHLRIDGRRFALQFRHALERRPRTRHRPRRDRRHAGERRPPGSRSPARPSRLPTGARQRAPAPPSRRGRAIRAWGLA